MMDLVKRHSENPILRPGDVAPSFEGAVVECLLNPGAFRYRGRVGLLMRVAERVGPREGMLVALVAEEGAPNGVRTVEFAKDDPALDASDPRLLTYAGETYLTTLSHLRLAWSADGVHFTVEPAPAITGKGELENFGVEDCRVTQLGETYYLTYSAVSEHGVGVALQTTTDWQRFTRHGMIFPPHNKDCTLFDEKIGGEFAALHRPVGLDLGGPFIWYATSPDLVHWGRHVCLAHTRKGMWDCQRIGAGAAPIRTEQGWLELYHGCDEASRYCLGALLLDLEDPTKVLARSREPIMEPLADYEQEGFFGNVVFTNGHLVDGDTITLYYGASDSVICIATLSIAEVVRRVEQEGIEPRMNTNRHE
jgi:predicted GH43/DUF377 family glycosyl hydrolase